MTRSAMLADASSWYGTVSSQYDLAGRRTRLSWRDGFFVDYDHLVTGETVAIRENGAASGIGVLATFAYDDLGRRTSLVRGNGIATYYGYDAVSRLDLVDHEMPGVGNDAWLTMRYNPASQIVERGGAFGWYEWSGHGSGTTASSANGLNQITARGGTPLAWDSKGNLASDGTRSFAYTAENRLASGAGSIQYYDPLGRLFYVSGGANLNFHFDGSAIVEESDAVSGSYRRRYVHGPGTDEPLVWYEGPARRWLIADERGSIMGAFDDSGAGIGWAAYDEYGQTQETGNIGRFGYTGQARLPELGLYYYKARMYDPKLGFLQPDPIGLAGGPNPYLYAGADPVNGTDPTGLEDEKGSKPKLPDCTGTRIAAGCGAGGIASGLSGFSTAGIGGQYPTGEASLNALGVDTTGMSGAQMRALAGEFLHLGEWALANGISRDAVVTWGFGQDGFSASVFEAGVGWWVSRAHPVIFGLEMLLQHGRAETPAPRPLIQATPSIRATLDRIEMGIAYPHRNDGAIFQNREGKLPQISGVTYREYVVPTTGGSHAGMQRIVIGSNSSIYYTPDHYQTFFFVKR